MKRQIIPIGFICLAGYVCMPFIGIIIHTVCLIAVIMAFGAIYGIISDIETRKHERIATLYRHEPAQIEYRGGYYDRY